MNNKGKNILALAGAISAVVGIVLGVPFLLQGMIIGGMLAMFLLVGGLVLLAIGWGD